MACSRYLKFLFIFLLFILFIFLNNNSVFATITFTKNGTTYNAPDFPSSMNLEHKLIVINGNSLDYYSSSSPFTVVTTNSESGYGLKTTSQKLYAVCYYSWNKSFSSVSTYPANSIMQLSNTSINNVGYCTEDLYYTDNQGIRHYIYKGPETYNNLPYFLNSEEDIAIGNQDIIIMPRRFSKY